MIDKRDLNKLKITLIEENNIMKNKWKKPELVILVRSNPEENVLTSDCKYNAAPLGVGGPQTGDGHGCQATKLVTCQSCQGLGGGGS